ncbi:MAG: ATP-binding cassette domain-containing protein, partial [Streptococcaceae bacterium]|nr:ATP-binding cassette domain-containing protein [Streptococcaceae bacterium]
KSFTTKKQTKEVLSDIDLIVEKGEIFALLGSNGAGKTTMMNIMSTLLTPDSGTVSVNGFDVVKNAGKVRQSFSLTGQFAAVDDILTGHENLELIAKLRKVVNPKQVAAEMLEKVSLTEAANKALSTYSGGMRRRIDIAMSLIGAPAVIFLDEPTTGLDPEARNEVYDLVEKLAADGTTFFLTTQYLEEAEKLAQHIAILHEGVIVANGTFDELKQLIPAPEVVMVEKQPTLEDIFLNIIAKKGGK